MNLLANTYREYLRETETRAKNRLFESMCPSFDEIVTGVFQTLKMSNIELQDELRQRFYIKIFEKVNDEMLDKTGNRFPGYLRYMFMNLVRDYFKLEGIYSKHQKKLVDMISKGGERYENLIVHDDDANPQSIHILKTVNKY